MLFLSPWRLATLFIVAGYASRALLARLDGPGRFMRERTKRLLAAAAFAMVLIVPPQSWVKLTLNHGYAQSFSAFLAHDAFRFGRLDGVTLPGWEHLWFVFYLWLFTMALAAALPALAPALKARLAALFDRLGEGRLLLWLPLLYFVPVARRDHLHARRDARPVRRLAVATSSICPASCSASALPARAPCGRRWRGSGGRRSRSRWRAMRCWQRSRRSIRARPRRPMR